MYAWLTAKKRHYKLLILVFLIFLSLPSVNIFFSAFPYLQKARFFEPIFLEYFKQTLLLSIGVCLLSLFFGLTTAIFVTFFDFPAKRILEWGLMLPFVLPSYILAYIYTDFLEYAGFLQTTLRNIFGWESKSDYWFFEIRSMKGAILVLSFSLYPYLYLIIRKALASQSEAIIQSAQLLGYSFFKSIFFLLLPLIKKSIFLGLVVILVHSIHDFGVVEYFSLYTVSLGIYDLWFQQGNFAAASYLSSLIILVIFFLVLLDSYLYSSVQNTQNNYFYLRKKIQLNQYYSFFIFLFCLLIVFIGFLLPIGILVYYAVSYYQTLWESEFWNAAWNSIKIGIISVFCIIFLSSLLVYALQRIQSKAWKMTAMSSILSYTLPSTILPIGIILCSKHFDLAINFISAQLFSKSLGLIIGGSVIALIFAYSIKFFAVAQSILGESMLLITPSLDASGRNFGYYNIRILKKIYLPIAQKGFVTAAIILFVDIIRELPLTLILRPIDWNNLASYTYQYASDEMLEKTAISSLFIVLISLIPTSIFCYNMNKKN